MGSKAGGVVEDPSFAPQKLIDLYEETLTLRVGKEELVYYADKSEKNKHFVHAISVIDFSKRMMALGLGTQLLILIDPSPSSSCREGLSDNLEEIQPMNSLFLKKDKFKKENFHVIQILFLNLMTIFKSHS
ncbi:hypothetical protein Tco_1302212 [Tanacetum coccineum]